MMIELRDMKLPDWMVGEWLRTWRHACASPEQAALLCLITADAVVTFRNLLEQEGNND